MWQYNYDYYDLAPDELMHYGKLGMKWGVIHNPAKAYAKAINKRNSLNSKLNKNRIAYEKALIMVLLLSIKNIRLKPIRCITKAARHWIKCISMLTH